MKEPIKQGDRAYIVAGVLGDKGPNIGKTVTVGQCQGEHSLHGRIWRCYGEGLITEYGVVAPDMDFAADWLRKIEPPPLREKTQSKAVTT